MRGVVPAVVLAVACSVTAAAAFQLPTVSPIPGKPWPGKYLKVNRPCRFSGSSQMVIAGTKPPTAAIIINGKLAVPPNKYTTWFYEYTPASSDEKITVISLPAIKTFPREYVKFGLDGGGVAKLDAKAPAVVGIRFDPANRDIIITVQDPLGVLSYNVYYANSLTSSPGTTPFILAQRDVPVSGTGMTTWRDNGTYTGIHPSKVQMRFYKLEVNRLDQSAMEIHVISPQDGEVVVE